MWRGLSQAAGSVVVVVDGHRGVVAVVVAVAVAVGVVVVVVASELCRHSGQVNWNGYLTSGDTAKTQSL